MARDFLATFGSRARYSDDQTADIDEQSGGWKTHTTDSVTKMFLKIRWPLGSYSE